MIENNPTSSDQERVANFKPRARLLLQLGDQLIKNESIALLELAKNAYDADAGMARTEGFGRRARQCRRFRAVIPAALRCGAQHGANRAALCLLLQT